MDNSGVRLMPIAELLEKEFFIRSYQRGYRWEEEQVKDLLDDFNDFIEQQDKLEEEFYCLQPIVVKTLNAADKKYLKDNVKIDLEKEVVYEVIDGQQRITTILILLRYIVSELGEEITLKEFPIITYEVRPESKLILQDFINRIKCEDQLLENKIDFYHMKLIFNAITFWFSEKKEAKRDKLWQMLKLLTAYRINNVKVIWYEVNQDENSVAVFRRFNVGKIPLSNAELIKALLLKDDDRKNTSMIYSISKEWQTIENQLQDPIFWSFINPNKDYSSRIEFLFDLKFAEAKKKAYLKEDDRKNFDKNFGTDSSNVFRYYFAIINQNNKELQNIWDDCVEVFERINQWYKDPAHFHYIGYLQNREGKDKDENIVLDILSYKNASENNVQFKTKDELTVYLIEKIKIDSYSKIFFIEDRIELKYNAGNTRNLRDFFLLFNVEVCCKLAESGNGEDIYRLPFNLHKITSFDIEHIDSQTEKDTEKLKPNEQIDFIKDLITDFEEELKSPFDERRHLLFKSLNITDDKLWDTENIQTSQLKTILKDLVDILDEKLSRETNQIIQKDIIGNVTALNSSINRSYGNAYYNTKRRRIIEEDLEGTYIPIVTKNIFLKYYSKTVKKHTRWSVNDAKDYTLVMENTLKKFI